MTGLWLSFLRWKSNTNVPQKDAKQAQSNTRTVEGLRPGKSLSQIGLTGRAGFLPQHTCLWKAERESHALGTRSGNCLYMRVSNCSGIKRIRTWDANIAGIKGGEDTVQSSSWLRSGSRTWSHALGWDAARWLVPRVGQLAFIPPFHSWLLVSEQKWKVGIPSEFGGGQK